MNKKIYANLQKEWTIWNWSYFQFMINESEYKAE